MALENVEDIYPLTATQKGMLFHCISTPDSALYISQIDMSLRGMNNIEIFKSAWKKIIDRHSVLRAAFVWDGVDEPLQVIRQQVSLDIQVLDWRNRASSEYSTALATLMSNERKKGIDLVSAPLMRMTLIRTGNNEWRMLWIFHHLILDGWSVNLVLDELMQVYNSHVKGEGLAPHTDTSWADYISWLQTCGFDAEKTYWKKYLAGFTTANIFSTAQDNTVLKTSLGKQESLMLTEGLTTELLAVAKQLRITPSTLIHGAWAIVMHHYCGSNDLVFGSTSAGRSANVSQIESIVGMFLTTLPVRVEISHEDTLEQWFSELQQNLLGVRERESTPLSKIQAWSDLPAGETLFDSIVVYENYPEPKRDKDNDILSYEKIDHIEFSNFPLALLAIPGKCLQLLLVHHQDKFPTFVARQILRHLHVVLSSIHDYLDQPPANIPLVDSAEQLKIKQWNNTDTPITHDYCIHQLIEQISLTRANHTALSFNSDNMSYQQLDSLSNQWAHEFITQGILPGDRVAICLERSIMMIVVMLATLKAGGTYVPLDPYYPQERLTAQITDCEPKIVIVDDTSVGFFSTVSITTLNIKIDVSDHSSASPNLVIDHQSIAYVIYTSGSSGQPKGVEVTHENLLYSTTARNTYYVKQPDVFLLLSSFAFDSSIAGIFWTLINGGELCISEHRLEQDIEALAHIIRDRNVTHTLCLPSLLQVLLKQNVTEKLQSLNTVIVAGEQFPSNGLLRLHKEKIPHAHLYNEYGPTETTVWATVFNTIDKEDGDAIPIGKPITNTQILLLDTENRICPIGVSGEIVISGKGVAAGYLHREYDTKEKFITLNIDDQQVRCYRTGDIGRYLSDGNIEFLGRCDNQIKIRGYRIEPQEIADQLCLLEDVDQAYVISATKPESMVEALAAEDITQLVSKLQILDDLEVDTLMTDIETINSPVG